MITPQEFAIQEYLEEEEAWCFASQSTYESYEEAKRELLSHVSIYPVLLIDFRIVKVTIGEIQP